MKVWVLKLFGREILRTESHQEATVSDVVRAMVASRLVAAQGEEEEGEELIECECCGEMFDPAEAEAQAEFDDKFEDIAGNIAWGEKLVWDVKTSDDEEES